MNKIYKIISALSLLATLSSCNFSFGNNNQDDENVGNNTNVPDNPSIIPDASNVDSQAGDEPTMDDTYVKVTLNNEDTVIENNNGNVSILGQTITITGVGYYYFTGNLSNGSIVINNEAKDQKIHLILNGVDIKSLTTSPIYAISADRTLITLVDGSINKLTDASTLQYTDSTEEEPNACLFAKDDLTIKGNGTLYVNGNFNNGITSKDDLKINDAPTISIYAKNHGIKGNDSVTIKGGLYSITSGGDAIKSSSYEDYDASTNASEGLINIEDGEFNLIATGDGIDSATDVLLQGGTYFITTCGGADSAPTHTSDDVGGDTGGFPGGTTGGPGHRVYNASTTTTTESCKGIKAGTSISSTSTTVYGGNLQITGGYYNLDTYDDSIHSDNVINLAGGEYKIASGDDGLHADTSLSLSNTNIDIAQCYEGVESALINFNDGSITHILSSDDGVNGSTGSTSGTAIMNINEGSYIYVNTSGDGLDSNGSIIMTGGTAIVTGPNDGGNGPLDTESGFYKSGGILLAMSISSAMTDANFKSSSNYTLQFTTSNVAANTTMALQCNSQTLISFDTAQSTGLFFISTPSIALGSTYSLYSGGTNSGTKTDLVYSGGTYSGGSSLGSLKCSSYLSTYGSSSSGGFGR